MRLLNSGFKLPAYLLVGGLLATTALADTPRREHEAHQHGVARLNVAIDGTTLQLELISPAVNIVGFEYHPASPEEHQAVEDAVAALQDGQRLFTPDPTAGCQLTMIEVDSELLSKHHDDEHHDDEHHDEMHSEFNVSYRFDCSDTGSLQYLDVRLFQQFSGMESLETQVIGPRGQTAQPLSPEDPRLLF